MHRLFAITLCVLAVSCERGPSATQSVAPGQIDPASLPYVGKVWLSADFAKPKGTIRIFLPDGTLVMDSCWETYQLAKWRAESDSVVSWQEGPAEIRATVVELAGETLVLRLDLVDGSQEEHFRAASVPYLCPDMRR